MQDGFELDQGDSDVEFWSDEEIEESVVPVPAASEKSPQGDALRNLRKQVDFTMTFSATMAEGSNLNQPKEPQLPEVNGELLSIDEGWIFLNKLIQK